LNLLPFLDLIPTFDLDSEIIMINYRLNSSFLEKLLNYIYKAHLGN